MNFSAALDPGETTRDRSLSDEEDEDVSSRKVSSAQYQLFCQAVTSSIGSYKLNPVKSRRAARASLMHLGDREVSDRVSWLDQPSLTDTMVSTARIAQSRKEDEAVEKTTLSESLIMDSSSFKHLTVKQVFPREPYQYLPKPPSSDGFSDSKLPTSYQIPHRMSLDTEELARRAAIYASLADSMVASVIEELSPKEQRSKLLPEKLAIIQEAQVAAVSAGFAAASNLQLLWWDALLKNFGFQPQVLSTVRTVPFEGSHVLGPEPKVLQQRVQTIRHADCMASSSVTFIQDFQFIGMQFSTRQFTVAPVPKMRLKVQSVHQHWMTNPIITTRDLHRLLGMVVLMATQVPRGRLRLHPVQWWAATAWCQRTGNWSDRITVPQWVLSEVACWASPAVLQGLPLATKETEVTLFTDASISGWGAKLGSRLTQGLWSASQRSWHINVLEMQAVINAVRDFLPHLRFRVVCLLCDNAVTVAYIKNEGGTRSYTLMQMTISLLKWCDRKTIMLVPIHLPGVHNIQADSLSRVSQTLNTEWAMAMERLRPVFAQWGEPQVDLFATFASHQVCFVVSGPQGRVHGRHVSTLGQREEPPVCIPAIQDGPSSSAENRSVTRSQGDSDCSTAGDSFMVSGVDGSVTRRSHPAVRRGSATADSRRCTDRRGDRDSSIPAVKSTRVETLRAIPEKLLTWCQGPSVIHRSRCMNLTGRYLCLSVGRNVGMCFMLEAIISAPIWCTCSETDFSHRW